LKRNPQQVCIQYREKSRAQFVHLKCNSSYRHLSQVFCTIQRPAKLKVRGSDPSLEAPDLIPFIEDWPISGSFSGGRPGVSDWAAAAEHLRLAMARIPSPLLERAIGEIPDEYFVHSNGRWLARPSPKVARRWITVLEQLERLEEAALEEFVDDLAKLRDHPVGFAELVCRWANYDTVAAVGAARRVLNGELTVERLRREEMKARLSNRTRTGGRQYGYQLRRLVEGWATLQLKSFERVVVKERNPPPGDILFKRKGLRSFASVLIHGPYKNASEYETRRISFLGLVVGTAACAERVIALVPSNALGYWDWFEDNNLPSANIEIFEVPGDLGKFEPTKVERSSGAV
jgi:hypothetical protein